MKKVFLYLFLLNAAVSYSQWSYVSTIPGSGEIYSMSVLNQNLIWVCSDNRVVLRSTNGGVNWDARNFGLPAGNITSISALDTSYCWIGTESGSIYKTSNGGYNWTLQFSLTGSFADGIKMFNQSYGIYYGDPAGTGRPPCIAWRHSWPIPSALPRPRRC